MSTRYESPLRDLARQLRIVVRQHIAAPQVAELMNHVDEHLNAMAFCEERNHEDAATRFDAFDYLPLISKEQAFRQRTGRATMDDEGSP